MTAASPLVLDHVQNPRNVGAFDPEAPGIFVGRAEAPGAVDRVVIYLSTDRDRVTAARFRASGCPALIASASRLTERVSGLSRAEAAGLDAASLAAELALPAHQVEKAALAIEAFVAACTKWEDAGR